MVINSRMICLIQLMLTVAMTILTDSKCYANIKQKDHNYNIINNKNNSYIYIIRHGEKKWLLGCLSKAGEERAEALKSIFQNKFSLPNHIFANFYDDHIDCERCIETVIPIAKELHLTVNSTYGYNKKLGGNKGAANAFKNVILTSQKIPQTLLVAWEHINIKPLTEALGVPLAKIPSWKGSNFDTVYVLAFNSTAHLISFDVSSEGFTPP